MASEIGAFIEESNRIEGIHRTASEEEIVATLCFLKLDAVAIEDLEAFVTVCAGAKLRTLPGMDVRVGDHVPQRGGPAIRPALQLILNAANYDHHPYGVHVKYETLHPFMDGNGRSGRVLWAWQMLRQDLWPRLSLGFLHAFYYQALQFSRKELP